MTQSISAVFFDLDGTLLDSQRGIIESFRRACAETGIGPLPPDEAIAREIGPPFEVLLRNLGFELPPEQFERFVARYRAHYWDLGPQLSPPFEGIPEVLEELSRLKDRIPGFVVGVATNKLTPVAQRVLEHVGLGPYFDVIQGLEPGLRPKPAPDILLRALSRSGARPANCLFVGDTGSDLLTARAAGTQCGLAAYGYGADAVPSSLVPDLRIEHPQELLGYLRARLPAQGKTVP